MAHSVEARVPFLDYRLVEALYSVGASDLIDNGVTKAVLRRAVGDLLPPPVRDRVDKLGFVTPSRRFFRGAFGEYAAQLLASPQFAAREFVDVAEAQGRLAALRAGQPVSEAPVWRALNLELWARAFLD